VKIRSLTYTLAVEVDLDEEQLSTPSFPPVVDGRKSEARLSSIANRLLGK